MKSIIFDSESVRAILRGDKTQTRRIVKPQPPEHLDVAQFDCNGVGWFGTNLAPEGDLDQLWPDSHGRGLQSRYRPGEVVYVKETFAYRIPRWECVNREHGTVMVEYAATPSGAYSEQWMNTPSPVVLREMVPKGSGASDGTWRSPLFMPEWASRIRLEIAGVRVERLQDISEADAVAEGLIAGRGSPARFAERWDEINAKRGYAWETNPWVWIYEFRRVE